MAEKAADPVPQPTAEEHAQMAEVGQAGAEAAATGGDVTAAMKAKRDEVGLKMSDQDLESVAENLFGKLASLFEERGAFDPAPDPVQPPAQPVAPEAPPAGAAAAAGAEQIPPPAVPVAPKRTVAQRFFGTD